MEKEQLLDVEAVAEQVAVSKRTVHRLNASGRMPRPVRVGGCLRWRSSDVADWINLDCPDRKVFEAQQVRAGREVAHGRN